MISHIIERRNQMSTTAKNVSTGKPRVGGSVFFAPLGTTAPTDATSTLSSAFKNMGYISDDGVSKEETRDSSEIKAWGGDVVLEPQTGKSDNYKMTFIESMNLEVLKAVHGKDNVSGTLATGVHVKANSKELDYGVWVIDTILNGDVLKRDVIPYGRIKEVAEVQYKDDSAIGYEVTIGAYPDSGGDTHHEYMQNTPSGTSESTSAT